MQAESLSPCEHCYADRIRSYLNIVRHIRSIKPPVCNRCVDFDFQSASTAIHYNVPPKYPTPAHSYSLTPPPQRIAGIQICTGMEQTYENLTAGVRYMAFNIAMKTWDKGTSCAYSDTLDLTGKLFETIFSESLQLGYSNNVHVILTQ